MNFSSALSFPFRGPKAWQNLGCLLVCFLIPIVGPIVAHGYLIIVQKLLVDYPQADAPAFEFAKFGRYLERGVPMLIVGLIYSLVLVPLMVPLGAAFVISMILVDKHPGWLALIIPLGIILYLAVTLLLIAVAWPMSFKAGLEGRIEAGFDFRFLPDYWKRVGLLMIGMQLLMFLLFLPVALVGLCVPIVGPYAAMAAMLQIQAHIAVQLYLIYLDRGGTALAIKPEPVEIAAFPVDISTPVPLPGSPPPPMPPPMG